MADFILLCLEFLPQKNEAEAILAEINNNWGQSKINFE